jgi:hypothetical protein
MSLPAEESSPMSMPTEDVRALIRQQHGSVITGMVERITGERIGGGIGTVGGGRRGPSSIPALLVLPSVTDPAAEVHVGAATIPVCSMTEFTGDYAPGAHMIAVSVHGRHTRTGRPAELPPTEIDAWGTVLAPIGYEEYVIRLGVLTGSPSRTVHYRFVLGPDHTMHILRPHDNAVLTRDHRYQ